MIKLKLSIIIPCYNCSETLREAVESCYTQGFKDNEFEILLVDDFSTDKTHEVMKALASTNSNIRLKFQKNNCGAGQTRNTGIALSNSDVIICLDSDDLLPVGTLDNMYKYLKKKKCDGVGFHHSINFNGRNVLDIDHVVTMAYVDEKIPFESLFQKNDKMCSLYQVFMLTKTAFNKTGGYPTTHAFDTQGFAWRFLANDLTAYTCPNACYFLRINLHESYYMREYNQGKTNFNWQSILVEHLNFFNDETQKKIKNFDCTDFTKSILKTLGDPNKVLRKDYKSLMGKTQIFITQATDSKAIPRNSLRGIYMRIINRMK